MSDIGSNQSFAVSRNLQNAKNHFWSKNLWIYQNQWYHTNLSFNINIATVCVTSNMKNSSRKTWQTSHLVLKPLQIQTLREKSGGTWHIMSHRLKKWGTRPPCPPPNCAHVWRYIVHQTFSANFCTRQSPDPLHFEDPVQIMEAEPNRLQKTNGRSCRF